jgi:uncharacterized membrane protein
MIHLTNVIDAAALLLRWLHVVAAIVWVGSAFALARLDFAMKPRGNDPRPQTLFLHAGAGFRLSRAENADADEPALDFKWEAYTVFVSGFLLLILAFCLDPRAGLVDAALWDAPAWAAAGAALALPFAVWLAYDFLCKKSGLGGDRLLGALFLFAAALALLLMHVFAGSAALPLLGANLGTIMVANMAHVVVPAQRRRLATLRAGAPADAAEAQKAAARAAHNQYLALPTIFFMLSGHAPWLLAATHRDLVACLLIGAGFLIRRTFLKRARGFGWDKQLIAGGAACLVAAFALAAL